MTETNQKIKELKLQGRTLPNIAEELGMSLSQVRGRWGRMSKGLGVEAPKPVASRQISHMPGEGHGLDELRQRYDKDLLIPKAIDRVITKFLTPGKWLWDYEMLELVAAECPASGVKSRWSRYRDRQVYQKYLDKIDDKRLWLNPDDKEEFRRIKTS